MLLRAVIEVSGVLLVVFTLREVFRDIFHPTLSGNLSDAIGRVSSLLLRHTRLRSALGALALITVLLSWVVLLCIGFAVIYFGLYPQQFTSTAGVDSMSFGSRVLHCLYFSMGALCTFQTFDLNPGSDWLRLIVAIEGLVGISMITASVSWLVLIYPALERQRRSARQISLVAAAERRTGLSAINEFGAPLLLDLARDMLQVRLDLILFPILLHFHAASEDFTLSCVLPVALKFAREGAAPGQSPAIRLAADQLQVALEGLASSISSLVLRSGNGLGDSNEPDEVFRAFAEKEG